MAPPMTPEEFSDLAGVSRETMEKLQTYLDLLQRWNKAINLVGRETLKDPWRRHFLDSAQLWSLLPGDAPSQRIVDLGSGAGFPGLVLSIMGAREVHLIEADQRKVTFMRHVSRETGAPTVFHNDRIEALTPFTVPVVTARALAPLPKLLGYAAPFLQQGGISLFLKGREAEQELTAAATEWKMKVKRHRSKSSDEAIILEIGDLARVS